MVKRKRTREVVGIALLAVVAACSSSGSGDQDAGRVADTIVPDAVRTDAGTAADATGEQRCGPCEGGAICLKYARECSCRPFDHTECRDLGGKAEIWWVDSCGEPTEKVAECPSACQGNVCSQPVGQPCDPNDFQKRCETGRPVTCEAGQVTLGTACAEDERCTVECPKRYGAEGWSSTDCRSLLDEEATCLPEGPPCDPFDFEPRCDGDRRLTCDYSRAVLRVEDCAAEGKSCTVKDDSPSCVAPGLEPCSGIEDDHCLDTKTIKHCRNGAFVTSACAALSSSYPTCYSFAGGARGSCGPVNAEPCEPADFAPRCDGDKSPVNCSGWIHRLICNPLETCKLSVYQGASVAVCSTAGSKPCDPATYQGWCKGNTAVSCIAGLTYEQDCYSHQCQALGATATCVVPDEPEP